MSDRASFCFSMWNKDLDVVRLEMVVHESDKYLKKREIGLVKLNISEICLLLRQNNMIEMWRDILPRNKVCGRSTFL